MFFFNTKDAMGENTTNGYQGYQEACPSTWDVPELGCPCGMNNDETSGL